jgi:hypothetical protein
MLDKWLVSLVWCGVLHAVCLLALYGSWVEMVTRLCLYSFDWVFVDVKVRGAGVDGIPPCPAWENRPWWWLRFKEPPSPHFHLASCNNDDDAIMKMSQIRDAETLLLTFNSR